MAVRHHCDRSPSDRSITAIAPLPHLDASAMINQEGPDLLEMIFVAFVLAGIAYSFTH